MTLTGELQYAQGQPLRPREQCYELSNRLHWIYNKAFRKCSTTWMRGCLLFRSGKRKQSVFPLLQRHPAPILELLMPPSSSSITIAIPCVSIGRFVSKGDGTLDSASEPSGQDVIEQLTGNLVQHSTMPLAFRSDFSQVEVDTRPRTIHRRLIYGCCRHTKAASDSTPAADM